LFPVVVAATSAVAVEIRLTVSLTLAEALVASLALPRYSAVMA